MYGGRGQESGTIAQWLVTQWSVPSGHLPSGQMKK